MEFKWNKENVLKILKLNNDSSENSASPELLKARKNIYLQAGLAVLTIVLTIVILFSMTSAWYTNIVQTSGLIFEVESWGYNGEIIIDENPISAGPGDSGVVGIELSGGEEILEASINISKQTMLEPMQERIFFYVDTAKTVNGESVDRIYVNEYEDYGYTVFKNGSIQMSEDFSNVPELKWQWVYDVLGYYVLAETVTDENGEENFVIKDYLRPIEYNFDLATFIPANIEIEISEGNTTEVSTKQILTVDGERSPEQFLEDFSETDGYSGKIVINPEEGETITDTKTVDNKKYYYVGESNGYGIYAYLCSYYEVDKATVYDTMLGSLAMDKANNIVLDENQKKLLSFTAKLSVSVEKKQFETTEVSSLDEFVEAIAAEDGKVIQLSTDIALGSTFEVPEGGDIWIDLNGNSITSSATGSDYAIKAGPGTSITLMNGTLENENEGKNGRAINAVGAEVNLSNVNIKGFDYGMFIGDNTDQNTIDSTVRISGGEFETKTCTFFISGNGILSEGDTKLVIEGATVISDGYAVCGNGTVGNGTPANSGRFGTDIQIINSKLSSTGALMGSGFYAVIYHPQKDSTLTICEGSTVTGPQGISIKGGTVNIVDSRVTGEASASDGSTGGGSGSGNTGDAVYIETNYGYAIKLVIDGNSYLTGGHNYNAISIDNKNAANVSVEIIKGTFNPAITNKSWVAKGSVLSTEGTMVVPSSAATGEG